MRDDQISRMILRFAGALLAGLLLALILSLMVQTRTDVDLWGHLRFGLDILSARGLHTVDPYSFTSDRRWINHEWLSEAAMALAWRFGEAPGLILLKLACTFGGLGLIASVFEQRGIRGRARAILLGLTLLGILPRISQVRPQLFSVVLFAALLRALIRSDGQNSRALLWTIPVMTLWANLHGGWLVGVATVALWSAGEAYASRAEPARALLALGCAGAAAAATVVNPYGVALWTFLFETVGFGREGIREWGPAWTDPATTIVWTLFALILAAAMRRMPWPRNPATALIPVFWGIAALRVGRLDSFFAMSVIGFLAQPVATIFRDRTGEREFLTRAWRFGALTLALVAMLVIPSSRRAFSCIGFFTPRWPEPEAVGFMRDHQLTGRMVTYFDWGEYAIWHLAPSVKVSMDGRRETVYTDRTISRHMQLYAGAAIGLAYLEELSPDYVWLPYRLPVVPLLRQQGWVTLFEGPRSLLLGRPASNVRAGARSRLVTSEPPERCFPGP